MPKAITQCSISLLISSYVYYIQSGKFSVFLKGQILHISMIVIFTVFWDFTQCFLRNAISESAEISRVGLPIHAQWQINYQVFVTFEVQFNKSENFTAEFYFWIFQKQWFSWIFLLLSHKKRCFPRFSMFSVLYSISVIFLCFPYRGKLTTRRRVSKPCENLPFFHTCLSSKTGTWHQT